MSEEQLGLALAPPTATMVGEGALIRTVLDNVADALITSDAAGQIVACNPAAERLFGYRASEIIGAPMAMLFAEAYVGEPFLGTVRPQVANAPDRRSGGDRNAGFRRERDCRRRDGTYFPAELHVSPMPISTGLWYVASVRDVSEQRATETALARQAVVLREQEELLALSHDAIIVCDLLGAITFWNPAAAALYGWASDELPDHDIHELLQTRFPDALAAALDELLRTGRWEGVLHQARRDGTGVIVETRWALRRDAQGQPTSIVMINRDVTARQRAELKVRVTLKELERQYREADRAGGAANAILNATSEAIVLVAPDKRLLSINRSFANLFGIAPPKLIGRSFDELGAQVQHAFADPREFYALVAGTAGDDERQFTASVAQAQPAERELHLFSAPVWSDDGVHLGRLYVFRDVTAERAVDRLKSELIALVSHELRTPLAIIKGFVELLEDPGVGPLNDDQREFLAIVRINSDRLLVLINDLLDVATLEAGRLVLRRAMVDLSALIRTLVDSLRVTSTAQEQALIIDLPPELPTFSADPDRLVQVLTNLITNAQQYTPAGGNIVVGATAAAGVIEVTVRDTGVGLTPDEQARVFEKFYRARNRAADHVGGTGLGLTISRSLVELHGGAIGVESTPGAGSRFWFTLPVGDIPPA